MKIILDIICARQTIGSQTLFVKVHGHSAHPLHTMTDTLAVEGVEGLRKYLPRETCSSLV